MKKLKLDLDALEIDTFDPAPLEDAQGTVLGEQLAITAWPSCGPATCLTCGATCRVTCGPTCHITCHVSCYRTCGQLTCGPTCNFTCGPTCPVTCIPQLCGPLTGVGVCS